MSEERAGIPADEARWAKRFTRLLAGGNPVREVVEALLEGRRIEPDMPSRLLAKLDRFRLNRSVEQWLAVWALGHLDLEAPDRSRAAVSFCKMLDEKGWEPDPKSVFVGMSILPLAALGFLISTTRWLDPWILLAGVIAAYAAQGPFFFFGLHLSRWPCQRGRAMAAASLGRLQVRGALMSLAAAAVRFDMRFGALTVHRAVCDTLVNVLALYGPADYGAVDRTTLGNLAKLLKGNAPLQLAILRAFRDFGDGSVLNSIEMLAVRATREDVRKSAQETSAVIRERASLDLDRLTLLRAGEMPPDMLLVPATAAGIDTPQALLRPAHE